MVHVSMRYEDMPDIITPCDAAAYLGISVKTVYDYIHDGRIQAAKCGNRYRLRKEWLVDFLEASMGVIDR